MNEDALFAALTRDDEAALGAIYHRYAALVFTVAARVLDASTAEGIVQDVFLTIWNRRDTFDPARGSFKNWITRIARNHALNELRRQRGERAESDEALEKLPDDALEPDEALWAAHRRAAIRAAVDVLPAPQRKALSLAFFDELTHEQVAAALSIPVGTAKTRIRQALKRLAPILATALVVGLIFLWRKSDDRSTRDERALRAVTSSDMVPLRLSPSDDSTPQSAHGQYRARPHGDIAVVTTSELATQSSEFRYVVWIRHNTTWTSLGAITFTSDGRSMNVFENPNVASPDEVTITRESNEGTIPHAQHLLTWKPKVD